MLLRLPPGVEVEYWGLKAQNALKCKVNLRKKDGKLEFEIKMDKYGQQLW